MIERNAEPIAHLRRNPYKPIEFGAHPSAARRVLPDFISEDEWERLGATNYLERLKSYEWDWEHRGWFLKGRRP